MAHADSYLEVGIGWGSTLGDISYSHVHALGRCVRGFGCFPRCESGAIFSLFLCVVPLVRFAVFSSVLSSVVSAFEKRLEFGYGDLAVHLL